MGITNPILQTGNWGWAKYPRTPLLIIMKAEFRPDWPWVQSLHSCHGAVSLKDNAAARRGSRMRAERGFSCIKRCHPLSKVVKRTEWSKISSYFTPLRFPICWSHSLEYPCSSKPPTTPHPRPSSCCQSLAPIILPPGSLALVTWQWRFLDCSLAHPTQGRVSFSLVHAAPALCIKRVPLHESMAVWASPQHNRCSIKDYFPFLSPFSGGSRRFEWTQRQIGKQLVYLKLASSRKPCDRSPPLRTWALWRRACPWQKPPKSSVTLLTWRGEAGVAPLPVGDSYLVGGGDSSAYGGPGAGLADRGTRAQWHTK